MKMYSVIKKSYDSRSTFIYNYILFELKRSKALVIIAHNLLLKSFIDDSVRREGFRNLYEKFIQIKKCASKMLTYIAYIGTFHLYIGVVIIIRHLTRLSN